MQSAFTFRQIAGKNSEFLPDQKLIYNGKTLDLSEPLVMGILNLTPDSFYKGSRIQNIEQLIGIAGKMLEAGAKCLDLGAFSTRPGADFISAEEEADRLLESLQLLQKSFPEIWLSVDTFRESVARQAIENGASMINDISGGTFDENMLAFIAKNNIPYVLMHIAGTIETMHQHTLNADEIIGEVKEFFENQVNKLLRLGATQLVLDPGFGFGKSLAANYKLISGFEQINPWNFPVLTGVSRKSMIWKILENDPEKALNGTSVLHSWALQQGTTILRVHDVNEAAECIKLSQFMRQVLIGQND
ncbi:MAG: dihydropteroate synthase [Bacteroidales bacterium]|jgi:dihydropteroate synthase|nr:dihydropteroate synthase [Bacteroidales bacterium]HOI31444.1 dihydropteroate synthase [Bacteroidales bacterium]